MAKYKGVANPELHKAMMGLRSSNAAQPHLDKRTKRKRTRSAQKRNAIADYRGSVSLCPAGQLSVPHVKSPSPQSLNCVGNARRLVTWERKRPIGAEACLPA